MIAEKFWTTLAHTHTNPHTPAIILSVVFLSLGWSPGPDLPDSPGLAMRWVDILVLASLFFVGIEDTFGWIQVVFIPFSFSLLWSPRNPAGVENHNLMMWFAELEKKGPTTERGKNTRFMLRLRLVCRSLPIFLPRHNMSIRWWDFWQWPWSLSITFSSSTFSPPSDGWPHSKSRMESIFLASESSTKEGESSSKI